ncbi:hypothetical protein N9937_00320 [bacterium]|nr:hypothetical protein [bacterium]
MNDGCDHCFTDHEANEKAITDLYDLKDEHEALKLLCRKLREDLIMRGETDSDGCTVVDVSSTIWINFNEAIK